MTYLLKFREHVLCFREAEGLTLAQTAKRFGVGIATLTRWVKRIKPRKNYRRPWLKMVRSHGYAPKGKRCFDTQDWGARGRTNVIGALLGKTLLTAWLCDFNVDFDVFYAWVSKHGFQTIYFRSCRQ